MGKRTAYILAIITGLTLVVAGSLNLFSPQKTPFIKKEEVISSHSISLEDRYANTFVNNVFKDNILLTLRYMDGEVTKKDVINWNLVQKPFEFTLTLKPQKVFAFHDTVLPQFQGKIVKTTGTHFNSTDGFKSDGYLTGDGVCHLASLINWVARDAGLEVTTPVNHDFAHIPEVPAKYGTSIMTPDARQNLYIKNSFSNPVTFKFAFDGTHLTIAVVKKAS